MIQNYDAESLIIVKVWLTKVKEKLRGRPRYVRCYLISLCSDMSIATLLQPQLHFIPQSRPEISDGVLFLLKKAWIDLMGYPLREVIFPALCTIR